MRVRQGGARGGTLYSGTGRGNLNVFLCQFSVIDSFEFITVSSFEIMFRKSLFSSSGMMTEEAPGLVMEEATSKTTR